LALSTADPKNPGRWLVSYLNYKDYRDRNTVFSSLLMSSLLMVNFTGGGDAQQLVGEIASANYFSTLGVQPVVGRGFLEEEDRVPGARPVAASVPLGARGQPEVYLRRVAVPPPVATPRPAAPAPPVATSQPSHPQPRSLPGRATS